MIDELADRIEKILSDHALEKTTDHEALARINATIADYTNNDEEL